MVAGGTATKATTDFDKVVRGDGGMTDACSKEDSESMATHDTANKDNMVMVAGEATTRAKIEHDGFMRGDGGKTDVDSYLRKMETIEGF